MMADVAPENRAVGDVGKLARFLQRYSVFPSPPCIEMTAVITTEPRSAPAAVNAGCCLIVQAADIHRQTLHQKSSSPPDRIAAMLSELF